MIVKCINNILVPASHLSSLSHSHILSKFELSMSTVMELRHIHALRAPEPCHKAQMLTTLYDVEPTVIKDGLKSNDCLMVK